jgi:hypothetical protein
MFRCPYCHLTECAECHAAKKRKKVPPSADGDPNASGSSPLTLRIYDQQKRKRTFQDKWKATFPWVEYRDDRMFCTICCTCHVDEFTKDKPFITGCNTFRIDSLRAHERSGVHQANVARWREVTGTNIYPAAAAAAAMSRESLENSYAIFPTATAMSRDSMDMSRDSADMSRDSTDNSHTENPTPNAPTENLPARNASAENENPPIATFPSVLQTVSFGGGTVSEPSKPEIDLEYNSTADTPSATATVAETNFDAGGS